MVQAVLAARIDRLAEREKTVVQTAAVIGQEFGEGLLGRVTGLPEPDLTPALRALVAAEFLYASALFPETEYTFTHPLTQEVAYGSQLAERRARVHAAIGAAMEQHDTERLDEHAALLAHHWEGAGDALRAARWHRRAATWLRRSDFAEARRHLERVRALVSELPDSPERAELGVMASVQLLEVGSRLGLPEEEARALFEQGRMVAAGDPRPLDGLADLERALAEAEGREPADLLAIIHGGFIAVAGVLGDETMAMAHAQRVVTLAASAPSRIVEQNARWCLGEVHLTRGEWGDAVAAVEQGLALEREAPVAAWRLPSNLAMLAEAHGGAGNTERARTLATQAIDVAQERGRRLQEIRAQLALARVLLRADPAGARVEIETALARAEALTEETGLLSNAPFIHLGRA